MQCLENPSLSLLSLVRETGPHKDRENPLTKVEFERPMELIIFNQPTEPQNHNGSYVLGFRLYFTAYKQVRAGYA